MNHKEIKELIDFLVKKDIAEFELEQGDVKLRVKRTTAAAAPLVVSTSAVASAPLANTASAATPAVAPAATSENDDGLYVVKSPIVGTFYEAASPGAAVFAKEGDTVAVGKVLCIVEAMKLMNEIESEVAGTVVQVLVSNGQPVEYGQPLFKIRQQ